MNIKLKIDLKKIKHKYYTNFDVNYHQYSYNGNIIPSISNLNNASYFYYDSAFKMDIEEFKQFKENIKYASEKGNQIHDSLEKIIYLWNRKKQIIFEDVFDFEKKFTWKKWFYEFISIVKFLIQQDLTIIAQEEFVNTPWFAGKVDLVAIDNVTKKLLIIDFKSNAIFSKEKDWIQLIGYALGIFYDWDLPEINILKNNIVSNFKLLILHTKNTSYLDVNQKMIDYFMQNIKFYNAGQKYKKEYLEIKEERDKRWN